MTGSIKQNSGAKPFIVGVAGGSGSGKTYFAQALAQKLGPDACEIIYQDNFYIDQSAKFDFDGGSVNFDHPESIDFQLLAECLRELRQGNPVSIPVYEFATHSRKKEAIQVDPKKILLVDGILIFHSPEVRSLFDELIFFETPEELRYKRRLERDVTERGRTPQGVKDQFLKQVKPMHDLFVEPSKKHADFIIKDLEDYQLFLYEYSEKCKAFCNLMADEI